MLGAVPAAARWCLATPVRATYRVNPRLPVAPGKESQEREHEDDDQNDPEKAHSDPLSLDYVARGRDHPRAVRTGNAREGHSVTASIGSAAATTLRPPTS